MGVLIFINSLAIVAVIALTFVAFLLKVTPEYKYAKFIVLGLAVVTLVSSIISIVFCANNSIIEGSTTFILVIVSLILTIIVAVLAFQERLKSNKKVAKVKPVKEKPIQDPTPAPVASEPAIKPIVVANYREGSLELHDNHIVVYSHLLPFVRFTHGRIKTYISISDIASITYKGCGWFWGILDVDFVHFNRPLRIRFSRWLPWCKYKVNPQMEQIVNTIENKIEENILR